MASFQTIKYYITISPDSELITQLIFVYLFLTEKILKGFSEGLLTGMILIDPQKAFDTNHEILLKKLEAIGFSDKYV